MSWVKSQQTINEKNLYSSISISPSSSSSTSMPQIVSLKELNDEMNSWNNWLFCSMFFFVVSISDLMPSIWRLVNSSFLSIKANYRTYSSISFFVSNLFTSIDCFSNLSILTKSSNDWLISFSSCSFFNNNACTCWSNVIIL